MFVVNTTFCAEESVAIDVKLWCTSIYTLKAEEFGFTDVIVCKVLSMDASVDSVSYAVQMQCSDVKLIDEWFDGPGTALLEEATKKWGQKVLPFTTYMIRVR